jgi:ubiquinone/menaquinone biosynthesis C-methylase UbiE
MTVATSTIPNTTSQLVNGLLSVKPLFNLAKHQARQMMVKRSALIGKDWMQEVATLRSRGGATAFSEDWNTDLATLQNDQLVYPDYYLRPFHAYESGNLSWDAAMEVEVAAHTVHSTIWQKTAAPDGDAKLRHTYHQILQAQVPQPPQAIVDIGCSVGMSSFALQALYPHAQVTGVDLSPYFLAIAHYQAQQRPNLIQWLHAPGEATGLPDACCELVSIFLVYHELPQTAAIAILREARRLLRPHGHLALMDMNPRSEIYAKMPAYILTLLKSTEPYLDEYFGLDIEAEIVNAGFDRPLIVANSPRHRTIVAQATL